MTNCPNLCTAQKCEELERRVKSLEVDVAQLKKVVEQLKTINIDGNIVNDNLQIDVSNPFNSDSVTVDMSAFALEREFRNHVDTKVRDGNSLSHGYQPNLDFDLVLSSQFNLLTQKRELVIDGFVELENERKNARDAQAIEDSNDIDFEYVFTDIRGQNNQFELFTAVKINGIVKSDTAIFEVVNDTNISLDGFVENGKLKLFVATQSDSDSVTIDLPFDIDLDGYFENNKLYLTAQTQSDRDTVVIDIPFDVRINIDGFVENKNLKLFVATQYDSDSATIALPFVFQEDFDEHLAGAIDVVHKFDPAISINFFKYADNDYYFGVTWWENYSLAGANDDQILTIDMFDLEECCNRLDNKLNDISDLVRAENNQNQALLSGLEALLELRSGELETAINDVRQELQIDINGAFYSDFSYQFETDEDGDLVPTYAEESSVVATYSGRGIRGLHEAIRIIGANQKPIHTAAVKGISAKVP